MTRRVGKDRKFYDSHSEVKYKEGNEEKSLGWYFDSSGVYGKNNEYTAVIDFYDATAKQSVGFKAIISGFSDALSNPVEVHPADADTNGTLQIEYRIVKNSNRTISLSFEVHSASPREAEENLKRISRLGLMTSREKLSDPDNKKVHLKFSNLIDKDKGSSVPYAWNNSGLEGFIETLTYDFGGDNFGFIDAGKTIKNLPAILPKKINVQLTFTVDIGAGSVKESSLYGVKPLTDSMEAQGKISTKVENNLGYKKSQVDNILG